MSIWYCEKCKSVSAFNSGVCPQCGGPTSFATIGPPTPQHHIDAAKRAKALFKAVPLSEAEKLPDPDYGL